MTISIHLIAIPDDEVVASRVIYLPKSGGTFGRDTNCDVALPDQGKRISRVHGDIHLSEHGYRIRSRGKNSAILNDKPLMAEKDYPLNDGDILKVEGYTMLISTLVSSNNIDERIQQDTGPRLERGFNLNLDDETDFLEDIETAAAERAASGFSTHNVMSDDPFASDPFEDLDEEQVAPHVEDRQDNLSHQAHQLEFLPVETRQTSQLESAIDKLITLTEKNQQYLHNPMLQHDALFSALEATVDQFLDDLAPEQLEIQFSEYLHGSLFASKEKKYWRIYRKHFTHRHENGDFRRQFKALFLENMQKQREES
ncbi:MULTISPECIES: FHA domain-containing protein [unclassified Vibrio]|uniref:FHA domain-containing protein n=1 Tax=unclassified Vibrio TaxID=2614977 RepID=UPI001361557F|nr:FHA domain-containing protein [Vibrio sp. V36_P2S2PM302]NAX24281.1 FHA domain-containing protein [Vibrio sp. V38_P2S17PM301]NAX32139.1 FHA domain-containing protein [Vibrio sp. V37_P2S8PM304]